MKDEIKEILDKLNKKAEHYILYNYEVKLLLDYITNLQEENERLTVELNKNMIERNNYLSRNKKAIEFIKQNSKCGGSFIDDKFVIEYIDEIYNGMELLNILQGEDKNDK